MLWGSAYKSYLHMIEILPKKAIRNVHKTKYNEHTMPLFRINKILKIEDMYKLQLLMFMFSYYRNILPSPLYSLFTRSCDVHDHYTRCRKDPRAVARNTHIMTTSFICRGPELWGALSQNTKESKSLSSFKKQIKNIHINTYTNWIWFYSWSCHNIWSGWVGEWVGCITLILLSNIYWLGGMGLFYFLFFPGLPLISTVVLFDLFIINV